MNKSNADRIKEAKHYEWLAIKALFPEQAVPHLEIIGREFQALAAESLTSWGAQLIHSFRQEEPDGKGEAGDVSGGARKIHIDEN